MTSPFAKRVSGGDYFKAAEHMNDFAIILEPTKILRDQPHEIDGIKGIRDVAYAKVSSFRNSEDIATGKPSFVKDVQITNQVLVSDIDANDWLGKAAVVTIAKAKRAYVYRDPEPEAEAVAIAYYEKREAQTTENMADVPDSFE